MSQTTLTATPRTGSGTPTARRLRAEGHIPGVLYGRGMEPISVTVERREFRLALSGPAGANTVLALQVGGTSYPAVVKEMQRHPIRRTVNHIDFLQVNMNEEITVHVARASRGRVQGRRRCRVVSSTPPSTRIEVSCTPTNMPNEFVIDITDMQPDTVIRLVRHPDAEGRHRARRPRHGGRHGADHRRRDRRAGSRRRRGRRRSRGRGHRPPTATPPRLHRVI